MAKKKTKVKPEPDFQEAANSYAHSSIEHMRDELDALEHAQECNGGIDCPACADSQPTESVCEQCQGTGSIKCPRGSETKEVVVDGKKHQQMLHQCEECWHDEDAARRAIEEGPLSVEVRCSDWHTPGDQEMSQPDEYNILLGTGGPAARIIGDLNQYNEPTSAAFEYQDWFKPWTKADTTNAEDETMLEWARHFYFGG